MRKKNILINILFNALFISLCLSKIVLAGEEKEIDFSSVVTPLTEITQVLLIIAAGVCVGKVIHIGILYVMSSAMDKSNAKMAVLPWIVGTFLCFGAAVIGPAIINIFKVTDNVLDY
ncbi:MAG: hypothetical protein IJX99_04355 [Clostridia bacterium]|nr:hypothetical protein [Clostridia bacterium]